MNGTVRTACLQLNPGNDLGRNLAAIADLTAAAVADGATLVALPEFATFLDRSSQAMRASATAEADSIALPVLCGLARQHGIWLLIGSLVMLADGAPESKLANRSFLVAPDGGVVARYDKIHLFDARLPDGRSVGESRHYTGGTQAVVVQTPFGGIGMTICYDLRFPDLYRRLAQAGAGILTVPAAFTAETGRAHWEPLLRARAIETGCFVLAPATCGTHPGDWQTHGHAMIVDPWGTVLASCDARPHSFCIADVDLSATRHSRARIPSLATNPDFTFAVSQAL